MGHSAQKGVANGRQRTLAAVKRPQGEQAPQRCADAVGRDQVSDDRSESSARSQRQAIRAGARRGRFRRPERKGYLPAKRAKPTEIGKPRQTRATASSERLAHAWNVGPSPIGDGADGKAMSGKNTTGPGSSLNVPSRAVKEAHDQNRSNDSTVLKPILMSGPATQSH